MNTPHPLLSNALRFELERRYGKANVAGLQDSLVELFSGADAELYLSEHPFVRPAGASYNPRICRLLQLALESAPDLSREALLSIARKVPHELRTILVVSPSKNLEISLLTSVLLLDTLRHLHQSTWSFEEREQFVALCRSYLELSELDGLLRTKLKTSIEQQERILRARREVS